MPMRRWAAAGWYQHVNQAVATSAVTGGHEDCEGAARNRNMPCPRTVGICDCELALWIVGRDHCRGPGRGDVGFAHHSSPSLALVCFGSVASHPDVRDAPGMSAMPPRATASVRRNKTMLCANSVINAVQKTVLYSIS